jgi:radical SAM superfamily enzyme YgiQ (UPF0313 family)
MSDVAIVPEVSLSARAPGRPLRVVLVTFYNYQSHALRIFQPLLRRRGHTVHAIFFKNYFTYHQPTATDEQLVVNLIAQLKPDLVGMSVWSTYYQLAARLTQRIRAVGQPVVIWGGIHAQTRPLDCLRHADIVCRSEGEYVLAELTDRMSLGQPFTDLRGCWVRAGDEVVRNEARPLITDLDLLPQPDLSSDNKYYLSYNAWRDVAHWDRQAVSYDIMMVRGCPFRCTFCIHNYSRREAEGRGTYVRRRSVPHVMQELRAARAAFPKLRTIAFSDDIFAPSPQWLEEFCAAYRREIGLPFIMFSFPTMVDDKKVRVMRDAGLWYTTIGIQSGSERIRRDCYERATPDQTIIKACRSFARHGVGLNLDFIGDNPYETDDDRHATMELLTRLPKPFNFNFFSLTYFPGVDLTERALRDGFIQRSDVECMAQKGYHTWGGSLVNTRGPEALYWDEVYAMAVHGFPRPVIEALMRSGVVRRHVYTFARIMRRVRAAARLKGRLVDTILRRPNLLHQFWADTNRMDTPAEITVQPNADNSLFNQSMVSPAQQP